MRPPQLFIALLSALGLLVITFFLVSSRAPQEEAPDDSSLATPPVLTEPPITYLDPSLGSIDAAVTIVEYGDYACGPCQQASFAIEEWVKAKPKARRFVWKDAPNADLHPEALTAAYAGRCSQNQGAFWAMYKALMEARGSLNAQNIRTLAVNLGLDRESFDACMAGEYPQAMVKRTLEEALALNIVGTPSVYMNGTLYTGALTLDALSAASAALE
jgi:protein-disulfide isomerase